MNEAKFWALISETNQISERDAEEQIALISERLGKFPAAEVIHFYNLFQRFKDDAYRWDMWAAAYIINGGCSDDHFNDFRGWLIAQGQEIFEAALADPESLVKLTHMEPDMEVEGFDYIAPEIYERLTGKQIPFPDGRTGVYDPAGEEWEEDNLPTLLPKLWSRFGE